MRHINLTRKMPPSNNDWAELTLQLRFYVRDNGEIMDNTGLEAFIKHLKAVKKIKTDKATMVPVLEILCKGYKDEDV